MNQHGEIFFSWINNIFTLEIKGGINNEALYHYFPLIQEAVSKRANKNWKRLEIWDDETLGSPETGNLVKSIWEWYDQNGCALAVVVASNSVQEYAIHKMVSKQAKIFFDMAKAHKCLETETSEIQFLK